MTSEGQGCVSEGEGEKYTEVHTSCSKLYGSDLLIKWYLETRLALDVKQKRTNYLQGGGKG